MSEEYQTDSGASQAHPQQCSALRKGGYVILKERPCRVVEMSTSKTGKHGHAKVHLVGIDIFNGKKYEDLCPSTHNMYVPEVTRIEYQLIDITDDGYVSLLSANGDTKSDLKLPEDETLQQQIRESFDNGKDVTVAVLASMGEESVVAVKDSGK